MRAEKRGKKRQKLGTRKKDTMGEKVKRNGKSIKKKKKKKGNDRRGKGN